MRYLAFILVILASSIVMADTGPANEITNIQITNQTRTSYDVTWTTAHASTSQVVWSQLNDWTVKYLFPATADPTLVTSHSVTVDHQIPGTTTYVYVVSVQGDGTMSTKPWSVPTNAVGANSSFFVPATTLSTDTGGSPDWVGWTEGPHTAYIGYNTNIQIWSARKAGALAHLYIQNTGGYDTGTDGVIAPSAAGITVTMYCNGAVTTNAHHHQFRDTAKPSNQQGYCWQGNANSIYTQLPTHWFQLYVPPGTTPGDYTVTLTFITNGQSVNVVHNFTATEVPTVTPISKTPATIPNLAQWKTQMITLGNKWCDFVDAQNAIGNQIPLAYLGSAWYYDGSRAYMQIKDYDYNTVGMPGYHDSAALARWTHCAELILYPYTGKTIAGGYVTTLYRWFVGGMSMNYWRTGLTQEHTGVSTFAGYSAINYGYMNTDWMREEAYINNALITAVALGDTAKGVESSNLDMLISQLIHCAEGASPGYGNGSCGGSIHPFIVGIAVEALARRYRASPDPRIIPVVQNALDVLWTTNISSRGEQMYYNRIELPQDMTTNRNLGNIVVNNLAAFGYAWLWYQTGNTTDQSRANTLFGNALLSTSPYNADMWNFSGEQMSQEYQFSFDTVRLLQDNGQSTTDAAANPSEGTWAVTVPPYIILGTPSGITSSAATLNWTTYIATNSQVCYGDTSTYGTCTAVTDAGGVTTHAVSLSSLASDHLYHYKVVSQDTVPNTGRSADSTFATPPATSTPYLFPAYKTP